MSDPQAQREQASGTEAIEATLEQATSRCAVCYIDNDLEKWVWCERHAAAYAELTALTAATAEAKLAGELAGREALVKTLLLHQPLSDDDNQPWRCSLTKCEWKPTSEEPWVAWREHVRDVARNLPLTPDSVGVLERHIQERVAGLEETIRQWKDEVKEAVGRCNLAWEISVLQNYDAEVSGKKDTPFTKWLVGFVERIKRAERADALREFKRTITAAEDPTQSLRNRLAEQAAIADGAENGL